MAGPTADEPCPRTVRDALRWAIRLFTARQTDSPRMDAELLLAHVLQVERTQLLVQWDGCLSDEHAREYTALVTRALDDEPIPYLTGERDFYDVTLRVTPSVLIPRHETEHLVEEALDWAASHPGPLRIADVGTGSGALAIVLARRLPRATVWATDISNDALTVARDNARRYDLEAQVRFVASELLSAAPGPFEIIVANLPYIDPQAWPELQASVRKHEPRLALDGGAGGTAVIERLIAQLPERLAVPGVALLECDPQQIDTLTAAARAALPDAAVDVLRDLAGRDRVVRISREGDEVVARASDAFETRVMQGDDPDAISLAVRTLQRGGLVVFPTDTVYGVGCDLRNAAALERLYAAKERPRDMAIPVLISGPELVHQVARNVPEALGIVAAQFWPGGLTVILPRQPDLPYILTAGGDTIAVRLPDHTLARALIQAAGGALAVTSANRSG
ncbi:MAG: peptide chain release factor N(5)-glutamine methyltransferase, partial [Anaerolineae bacterium]